MVSAHITRYKRLHMVALRWTGGLRWWLAAVLGALLLATGAVARTTAPSVDARSGLPTVALSALPEQAQQVWGQIHQGGPFRFEKDGAVFSNHERLLPRHTRGFYRAYTVPTPGVGHRGVRRIVCGGWEPRTPEACFYTADHYTSFKKIVQ